MSHLQTESTGHGVINRRSIEVISGLAAGFTTTVITHPLDVIKVKLQLSHMNMASPRTQPLQSILSVIRRMDNDALLLTKQNHRPKAVNLLFEYYRGIVPNLLGNISAWGIYFTLYAEFKTQIAFQNDTLTYFTSSTLAGITTSLLTNPIWVLKTRILGGSRAQPDSYKSVLDGVKQMLRNEGIQSFWKGAVPSMFQVFQASLQITIYDHLKNYVLPSPKTTNMQANDVKLNLTLTTWQYLYTSATSKIISSLIMYPAQVVKSRIQNSHGHLGIRQVVHILYYKEGGYFAFYKGLSANIVRVLPATCITFMVYENVKKYLTLQYLE
ncbi:hypothetical protein LELG_05018 [Lodderomyces elongisporus NRRL YB-4239]|uniref:Mitochondrial thiamine pyrophosphate carrier 1 n=1 Tax=Lodderomyces elongisporus (strain ATCC 11503 / CBS 2605 / JCM 1781 / NBRC 1676 / NRRL YB-4239) TaxID=379508 RepID=A5E5X9_LODEL|nr:hypothetical protein LELG_05018 [Lodderomyces elongisporus NRRL YB-4239]